MGDTKFIAGAEPAQRLNFVEFFTDKAKRHEENYKRLRLEYEDKKKDLERLEREMLKTEGYVKHTKKMLQEWGVYNSDTMKIRQREALAAQEKDIDVSEAKRTTKNKKK